MQSELRLEFFGGPLDGAIRFINRNKADVGHCVEWGYRSDLALPDPTPFHLYLSQEVVSVFEDDYDMHHVGCVDWTNAVDEGDSDATGDGQIVQD